MRSGARGTSRPLPQQDRVSLVRREEAGVDARDAEQRDMRAVAQRHGRVAARRRAVPTTVLHCPSRCSTRSIARGLAETEDAVVARRGRSVIPGRLVACQLISAWPLPDAPWIVSPAPPKSSLPCRDDDWLPRSASMNWCRCRQYRRRRSSLPAPPRIVSPAPPRSSCCGAAADDRLIAECASRK